MTDDKILENLYKLQGLKSPESDKFIQKWIDDTKFDIAKSSMENVGLGDMLKTLKKIAKRHPILLASPQRALKAHAYILDAGTLRLLLSDDYGLPVYANRTSYADGIKEDILTARATKGEAVALPTRAELTSMLRWAKAAKEPTADYALTGGAHYNLQDLIDVLALFPNGTARITEGGVLYFEYAPLKGILLPSRR